MKLSDVQVKRILKNPQHKEFIYIASLLLLRNNEPAIIFKEYLNPLLFCKSWPQIKKRMRKDKWDSQRIVFWQAIFEKLREKYQKQGIVFREKKQGVRDNICKEIGNRIRQIRHEEGFSQKVLADKLGVSQQFISRIEKGRENISVVALKNIFQVLGKKLNLAFLEK